MRFTIDTGAIAHTLRFGLIVEQPAKVIFHFERAGGGVEGK